MVELQFYKNVGQKNTKHLKREEKRHHKANNKNQSSQTIKTYKGVHISKS